MKKSQIVLSIAIFLFFISADISARQSLFTYAQDGRDLFYFDIYDAGENTSVWTLGAEHIKAFQYAADYWSLLLGKLPVNDRAARIEVHTVNVNNAAGGPAWYDYNGGTSLISGIVSNVFDGSYEATVQIGFGSPYEPDFNQLSVLPNGRHVSLASVIVHEMGHAMGIVQMIYFVGWNYNSLYTSHLRDSFGKSGRMPINIVSVPYGASNDPSQFQIISGGNAYFQGSNVMSVLDGAIHKVNNPHRIGGIPVNGFEGGSAYAELSHLELRNSMMSHQSYRNWAIYMEAELALLQDIGMEGLDRKNFYGHSIYGDDRAFVISDNFYARNSSGTAYLDGIYNETPLIIGLHIYGTTNTVEMKGEVLSRGYGSAGIRVDGWANKLIIAPESKIEANGQDSMALLAAYGKNQIIIHRGRLSAAGTGGYGARFDFGDNILGDDLAEFRGSFIRVNNLTTKITLLDELKGALVNRFDVSGEIIGKKAAIFISSNAWVKEINIMQGAKITGNIISDWDMNNSFLDNSAPSAMVTNLNFGFLADAAGNSTAIPDTNFHFTYAGNISGAKSLNANIVGGILTYGANAQVRSFTIFPKAALEIDRVNNISISSLSIRNNAKFSIKPPSLSGNPYNFAIEDIKRTIFVDSLEANNSIFGFNLYFTPQALDNDVIIATNSVYITGDRNKTEIEAFGFFNDISTAAAFNLIKVSSNGTVNFNSAGFYDSNMLIWHLSSNDSRRLRYTLDMSPISGLVLHLNLAFISVENLTHNQNEVKNLLNLNEGNDDIATIRKLINLNPLEDVKKYLDELSGVFLINTLILSAQSDDADKIFNRLMLKRNDESNKEPSFWLQSDIGQEYCEGEISQFSDIEYSKFQWQVGYDIKNMKDFVFGLYFAQSYDSARQDSNNADIKRNGIGAYWAIYNPKTIMLFNFIFSHLSFNAQRTLSLRDISFANKKTQSDFSSVIIKGDAQVEFKSFDTKPFLRPFIGSRLTYLRNGDIEENGGDYANLSITAHDYTRFDILGGLNISARNGGFDFYGKVFYGYILTGDKAEYDVYFSQAKETGAMNIENSKLNKSYYGLGAGAAYSFQNDAKIFVNLQSAMNNDVKAGYFVQLGLEFGFGISGKREYKEPQKTSKIEEKTNKIKETPPKEKTIKIRQQEEKAENAQKQSKTKKAAANSTINKNDKSKLKK